MPLSIRPATERDLPTLAQFGLELARLHVALDEQRFILPCGGIQAFFDFFNRELQCSEASILLAEMDANPIGYAFVRKEPLSIESLCAPAAWLHDIYVAPEFRGSGAGRELLHAASETARQLGSTRLMLTVSPANFQARALYERVGMRTTMLEMRLALDTISKTSIDADAAI